MSKCVCVCVSVVPGCRKVVRMYIKDGSSNGVPGFTEDYEVGSVELRSVILSFSSLPVSPGEEQKSSERSLECIIQIKVMN